MLEALESIFCFIRNFQIGNYYEEDSLQLQNMCIWDNNLLPVLTFSSSNLESMHSLMYDIINTSLIITIYFHLKSLILNNIILSANFSTDQ